MRELWNRVKLGDVIRTNVSSYSSKDAWTFVNYLDTGNITEDVIEEIQFFDLSTEKLPSRAKRKVNYNSIVYSTVRPNQRHYGIMKNIPVNFLVSTGFTVIDVDAQRADADFIYHLLTQDNYVELLHSIAEQSVSAYPSIKSSDIEGLEIILPPLDVQKKVSSLLNMINGKIDINRAINKNLEEQVQAIYCELSSKLVGEPVSISEIVDVRDGTHDSPKPQQTGFPLITSKHLLPYGVDASSANYISEEDYNQVNERSKVDTGDILLSMIGTVGLISYVIDEPVEFAIKNVGLFKTSKEPKYSLYILEHLKSAEISNHIEKCLAGTTQKYISLGELRKLPIRIPSDTQIEMFSKTVSPLIEQIANNVNENVRLTALRDTILPKLMSGEIDVSEITI